MRQFVLMNENLYILFSGGIDDLKLIIF